MIGRRALLVTVALVFGVNAACASRSGSESSRAAEQPAAKSETAAKKEAPKAEKSVPPPAGTPLAKVQVGMSDTEVRKILGEPDDANGYITGKQFIPWYFGSDTSRTDWVYKGKGRVVFSRNAYSGNLKVVRVDYNPNEGK